MASQTEPSLAERKKKLVAQGASFRAAVSDSKHAVKANLRPATLAKSALSHIAMSALSVFKNRKGIGLLPILAGGVSALSKRALLKPVLGGALILGAVGAAATYISKKKKARQNAANPDSKDE